MGRVERQKRRGEEVKETVAVAHLDSASPLEALVEDAQSLEPGHRWSCFIPSSTSRLYAGSRM